MSDKNPPTLQWDYSSPTRFNDAFSFQPGQAAALVHSADDARGAPAAVIDLFTHILTILLTRAMLAAAAETDAVAVSLLEELFRGPTRDGKVCPVSAELARESTTTTLYTFDFTWSSMLFMQHLYKNGRSPDVLRVAAADVYKRDAIMIGPPTGLPSPLAWTLLFLLRKLDDNDAADLGVYPTATTHQSVMLEYYGLAAGHHQAANILHRRLNDRAADAMQRAEDLAGYFNTRPGQLTLVSSMRAVDHVAALSGNGYALAKDLERLCIARGWCKRLASSHAFVLDAQGADDEPQPEAERAACKAALLVLRANVWAEATKVKAVLDTAGQTQVGGANDPRTVNLAEPDFKNLMAAARALYTVITLPTNFALIRVMADFGFAKVCDPTRSVCGVAFVRSAVPHTSPAPPPPPPLPLAPSHPPVHTLTDRGRLRGGGRRRRRVIKCTQLSRRLQKGGRPLCRSISPRRACSLLRVPAHLAGRLVL